MNHAIGFSKRRAVIFTIVLLIAAVHIFRIGSYLQGESFNLYYSYFSDIVLPFVCYFLLCATELRTPVLKRWEAKFAIAFLLPSIAETFQYFGIPILGSTFDPSDYLMYAIGALSAAVLDTQVFPRIFNFWNQEKAER